MINKPASIDGIAESISDLSTMIAKSILDLGDRMDKKFSGVDGRLGGIEDRLTGVNGRLDGVDGRLDGVEDRLTGLETSQRAMNEWLERVENETRSLHNDVVELYGMIR